MRLEMSALYQRSALSRPLVKPDRLFESQASSVPSKLHDFPKMPHPVLHQLFRVLGIERAI